LVLWLEDDFESVRNEKWFHDLKWKRLLVPTEDKPAIQKPTKKKCKAIKTNNQRCTRQVKKNSQYCWQYNKADNK
jgi:hypothetical protein